MYNTSFIKYIYIFVLFCVMFLGMYNSVTEAIAFKFLTGVQALYLVIFTFQLINDNFKNAKALRIEIPESRFVRQSYIDIPLYFIIFPSLVLQLISSVFVTLTSDFLQKKYNSVKLSRNDRWKLEMFKWMFIVATISLMVLIFSYCNDFNDGGSSSKFSGIYKNLLIIVFFSTIIFSVSNYVISSKLSKIILNSTD